MSSAIGSPRFVLPSRVSLFAFALLCTFAAPLRGATFNPGDLYLVTSSMPKGVGAGILHISMPAATVSTFYTYPTGSISGTAVYDPYRDLLLFNRNSVIGYQAIDATGTVVTTLDTGPTNPLAVTTRGDGTLYFWYHYIPNTDGFSYMDAAGTLHDLLDAAGTARYALGGGRYANEIIYDPGTNSLICATNNGLPSPCADLNQVCVAKVPLTADGHQVAGPVSTVQFDVSTSPANVADLSYAPGGKIFFTVDTNSSATEARMQTLDPSTMTMSSFASNNNFGAAATNAGTYSHVRNAALIDDTLDNVLREFQQGQVGQGAIFATGVSGAGTNEVANLIEVNRQGAITPVVDGASSPRLEFAVPVPNPSAGSVLLRYSLPLEGDVSLTIYDVGGRRVRALERATRPAGEHVMRWDLRDEAGRAVDAGIYFVRLAASGRVLTQRLAALR